MSAKVLVLGAGIAGMAASLSLADAGCEVFLTDKEREIGGRALRNACKATSECAICSTCLASKFKYQVEHHQNIRVLPHSILTELSGVPGRFHAVIRLLNDTRADLGAETALDVQAILVATGFQLYDAAKIGDFGYGINKRVLTDFDLERILRSSDLRSIFGEELTRIAFVQGSGSGDSRDQKNTFFSPSVWTNTYKLAKLLQHHRPGLYIDIFAHSFMTIPKTFDAKNSHTIPHTPENLGIQYIRGIPARAYEFPRDKITMLYCNTETGYLGQNVYDLLILCSTIISGNDGLAAVSNFHPERDNDGFYVETRVGVSTVDGIFLAGTCQGPKNIPQSVIHAQAAVGQIIRYLPLHTNR